MINKKIAIITYHRAINYGAILQAYSLQKKIKEFGCKCIILDYRNVQLEMKHSKRKLPNSFRPIKNFISYFLLGNSYNKKHGKFRQFALTNLEVTTPIYGLEGLKQIESIFDKLITGSDQVWNYKLNDMDEAYFLGFIKDQSKKASYAASFGVSSIPEEYKQKYKQLLNGFDLLLIRENQGADIIRSLLCRDSQVVLDPTLLLTESDWSIIATNNKINKKFILVYAFGGSRHLMALAKNISKRTGYRIVCISNSYRKSLMIKYIRSAGPEEFLELIQKAEYILTNSFHGTAFSINFNKQFFTELLPESHGTNSRIEDILKLFNLRDRIIKSDDIRVIDSTIDYTEVNKTLDCERRKSIKLLKELISNEQN